MRIFTPRSVAICLVLALAATGGSLAKGEIAQKGKLRVTVTGELAPRTLPRKGTAPISVAVGGRISTTDRRPPPQLKLLRIELNRNGRLDYRGLPVCRIGDIHPASSSRALAACRPSLVGQGTFWANIVLSGQQPYATKGRLLVFNGRRNGKPALLGQIYAARPFATSFVITFTVRHLPRGTYGTVFTASLPRTLGSWGYVTAIKMKLSRRYRHRGRRHSYISAGCPAPKGFSRVTFPLARTSFVFAGGRRLSSTLTRTCGARG
jgi:hypothetical protein